MLDEPRAEPLVEPPIRRAKSAATIYDIARLAGVNPSTVSRALGKPGRINAKTEERIHAAAKELNYRLNPMARALPTGKTQTLGLILADITNPMFFNVVRGAEQAAAARGYTLILAESQESEEREAETAERVAPSVDALILVTTRLADEQIQELASRKPLMVLNRDVPGVDSVIPDIEPGIEQALAHLAELGHHSVAFLSGPKNSWMSAARWELLLSKAFARGMTIVEVGPGSPTLEGGKASWERIRASGVSAVIAYNDLMAIGLLQAAQADGVVVPGGLSIIGFDDIFGSDFTSPPLTTIRTPLALVGELAVHRILDIVGGDKSERSGSALSGNNASRDPAVETELVIRGSTGVAQP